MGIGAGAKKVWTAVNNASGVIALIALLASVFAVWNQWEMSKATKEAERAKSVSRVSFWKLGKWQPTNPFPGKYTIRIQNKADVPIGLVLRDDAFGPNVSYRMPTLSPCTILSLPVPQDSEGRQLNVDFIRVWDGESWYTLNERGLLTFGGKVSEYNFETRDHVYEALLSKRHPSKLEAAQDCT